MKVLSLGIGALIAALFDLTVRVMVMSAILKVTIENIGPVYFPKYTIDTQYVNLCLLVLLVRCLRGVFLSWRTK